MQGEQIPCKKRDKKSFDIVAYGALCVAFVVDLAGLSGSVVCLSDW